MLKVRYYFLALFLLCVACSTNNVQGTDDGGSGGKDTTVVSTATPVNISLPEAVFTDPEAIAKVKHSKVIIDRLIDLINATPKGASIYMSFYQFEDEPEVVRAISKADKRDVKLHIMLDRSSRSNNGAVVAQFDSDIDFVGIHNDASATAINHNKFVLLSKVKTKDGAAKNVVFISSENLTPHSETEIQNAAILSNEKLYKAYLQYWKDMKPLAAYGMINFKYREFHDSTDGISAFFYPKRKDGKYYGPDPIVTVLNKITDPATATIQIEMPFWTHPRIGIVNKLDKLIDKGATVELVVRSNVTVHDELVNLAKKGAFVKMYNYSDAAGVKRIRTHSKVLMIQGKWKGKKTKVVVAGSENYTGNALKHNNENNVILNSIHFNHSSIFKSYEDNFNQIKNLPGVCCTEKN